MPSLGISNPRVAEARRLTRQASARAQRRVLVVEGPILVAEALHAAADVQELWVDEAAAARHRPLLDLARNAGAVIETVDARVIARVATTSAPQPVIALVGWADEGPEVLGGIDGLVLVLDQVADPGNVGTLLRSAEAAGVVAVVLGDGSADVHAPKVVRSSAGALFHVPVVTGLTTAAALERLVAEGVDAVGTRVDDATPYTEASLSGPVALVLGNEAHGVDPAAASMIGRWVSIPQVGRAESLNVAMAGTVLCFEALRQNRLDRARVAGQGGGS